MKLLKKIVPIAVAAFFSVATLGAAADLSTWNSDFVNPAIVVSSSANAGAQDIIAALDIASKFGGTVDTEVATSGETYYMKAAGDVFNYANDLDEMVPTGLSDDDLPTVLKEETFKESKGDNNNDMEYEQILTFDPDNAATLTLDLDIDKDADDEAAGTYIYFDRGDNIYEYKIEFEEDVEFTDGDEDADFDNAKLKIQGDLYTMTNVNADSDGLSKIELMSGALFATQGEFTTETYTLAGTTYEVEVIIISDEALTVKFKVNGETTDALMEGDTYELADETEIGVDEVMPNEGSEAAGADIVSFYLGAQKIELNNGGEVKINGQTLDDYTTAVTFTTTNTTLTDIAVTLEPDDDRWLGVGGEWVDPVFGNWKLTFAELEKTTEMFYLDVTGGDDGELSFMNNDGDEIEIPIILDDVSDNVAFGENADWINSSGTADANGEGVDITNASATALAINDGDKCRTTDTNSEDDCDGFPFIVISSAGEAKLYSIKSIDTTNYEVDIVDEQDGDTIVTNGDCSAASAGISITGMGTIDIDCTTDGNASITFDDIDLTGADTGDMETSKGAKIDLGFNGSAVTIEIIDGADVSDEHTVDDDGSDNMEIFFGTLGSWQDLVEDSDTEIALDDANWGLIYTNKDTTDDNDIEIEYPEEIDDDTGVAAKVYISELEATIIATGGGVAGWDKVLDSDAALLTGRNVISVGGSAINEVTADLLGIDYPTYGSEDAWVDATGVDALGKGIIKIIDSPAVGTVAMIVAGYEGSDTARLGEILANPADYPNIVLTGTEKVVDTVTNVEVA